MTAATTEITLRDRYELESGTVVMSGLQALVRVPLDQRRADRRAGLRTAGLISGYEGSPLGGYDLELARQAALLAELDITHRPGLNEELAATAITGSQQAYLQADALHQGVFGLWYGKAPGLDRATDAIRHGNLMGTHRDGGVVVAVGDDAVAKSSTVPSGSELALMDLMLPVLAPSDPQEVLELGLHAFALSRASGLWAGLKIATNVADGTASVEVDPARVAPVMPEVEVDGQPYRHEVTAFLVAQRLLELEASAVGPRLELARRYGVLNGLNRIVGGGERDRVGIVACGKSWRDLLDALADFGLDEDGLARHGVRLLKLGMPFPLDRDVVRAFADGLSEIVVVEEKRAFVETLIKDALYAVEDRPVVVGKHDEQGRPLLRASSELDPDLIAAAVGPRLLAHGEIPSVAARLEQLRPRGEALAPTAVRTPYFCSGCPHNSSTKVPEGSLVGGGIGCHGLTLLMPPSEVGHVLGLGQMGGEGAQWIGLSPFVATDHFIQNVGDGTFFHSASLALRAAVAAGVNVTFKLLYNSAVAMTGGQSVVGGRSVPELTRLLASEGVARIIVTTEDRSRYDGVALADNAVVWDRERLIEAQEQLAKVAGVTVLIHDQECATELRRKRKRGLAEDPATRVFINERVCEGCGDCGVKSNCLSVHPVETEFGRKTQIHQASCNKDLSCLDGDCPSFLTIVPGKARRRATAPALAAEELPEPELRVRADDFGMRLAGIGGTGVVTVAQVLAMAARLDGLHVAGLDQIGLAQKGGAVISDVRISRTPVVGANKLATAHCDLYLVGDLVAGAQANNLVPLSAERTVSVISTSVTPTAGQVVNVAAAATPTDALARRIERRTRERDAVRVPAQQAAVALFGTDQIAGMLLLGAAYQAGALPVTMAALERAIELNGQATALNVQAIRRGRQAVCDPDGFARAVAAMAPAPVAPTPTPAQQATIDLVGAQPGGELARLLAVRVPELEAYQSARYARRYAELVRRVRVAEADLVGPQDGPLALAVARHAYQLMAYKDEYEVARLQLDPHLKAAIEAEFGPGARHAWKLHPPLLRSLGMKRKLTLGPWFTPAFRLLRAMRRLRGTPFDPVGRMRVRVVERALVVEYEQTVAQLLDGLGERNHAHAVEVAQLPEMVRGYEEIKLRNVERYHAALAEARERFLAAGREPAQAA